MSEVDDVWRRKSDYDLQQAASSLFQYGPTARKAIQAELERRGFEKADESLKCPSCSARIGLREDHIKCRSCGKAFPSAFQHILSDWANGEETGADEDAATAAPEEAPSQPIASAERQSVDAGPPPPIERNPVIVRYRDGYRAAALVVLIGQIFKVLGVAIGSLVMVFIAGSNSSPLGAGGSFLAGTLMGLILGGAFFISGVFVAAHGQLLQATLDTAVSASPFLTDRQRARAMGLPESVARAKTNRK